MRRLILPAAGGLAIVTLVSCSADTMDFKEQGEKYLEGDEVRERMGTVRMSDAECQEPADTNKDTTYPCTAIGSDGNTYRFEIEIAGSTSLRVIAGQVLTEATVPATTDAPAQGSSPASTPPATATQSTPAVATTVAAGTTAASPTTAITASPATTAPG